LNLTLAKFDADTGGLRPLTVQGTLRPGCLKDGVFPRIQRAIELDLDGLKDGGPFEWKFRLERRMAYSLAGGLLLFLGMTVTN